MWRRATLLSSLLPSSKASVLNQMQAAYGLKIWEAFSTDILTLEKGRIPNKEKPPFITFVLGGPGSGKGTQCAKIVENFGFTHLSAGDLLRNEISSNSENGAMILDTIKEGKIVPSNVTVKLIQRAIESSDNDKFLIDGFPRTEENRRTYERILYSRCRLEQNRLVQLLRAFIVVCIYCLSTFSLFLRTSSPNFFPRKCLAAEETVAAAVAASAATAVEDTLRDLRWVWELRMVANVEPTAAVTLALANEQMTTS